MRVNQVRIGFNACLVQEEVVNQLLGRNQAIDD